jgi:hypothetical protein
MVGVRALSFASLSGFSLLTSFAVAAGKNLYRGRAVLYYCFGGHGQDEISMSEHMFARYATVYELLT